MEKAMKILKYDLLTSRKVITGLLVFFFVFGSYFAFMSHDLSIIPLSVMIWVSMLAGFPFNFRYRYGLDYLLATFPINRKAIIRGRILFVSILGAIGISLSEIMVCILSEIFSIRFDIREIFFYLCLAFLLYFLILAIHMPLYFKLTHTIAIQQSPLAVFVLYCVYIQLYLSGTVHINPEPAIAFIWSFRAAALAGVLLLCAAIMWLSYVVAGKIYFNKDL